MILALASGSLRWLGFWTFFAPVTLLAVIWPAFGSVALLGAAYMFLPKALPPDLTRFELTLPVHARVVLQARLLIAAVLFGVPALLWLISLLVQRPALVPLEWQLSVLPAVAMALTIAYLTPATRKHDARSSTAMAVRLQVALVAGFCAAVVYLLPAVFSLAVLSASSVMLYFVMVRRVPASLLLNTPVDKLQRTTGYHVERAPLKLKPVSGKQLFRLLLIPKWIYPIYLLPAAAFYVWSGPNMMALFGSLVVFGSVDEQRKRLRGLVSLPISHRQRLWLEIGPTFVPLCIGLVLGFGIRTLNPPPVYEVIPYGQETTTPEEWHASPTRTSLVLWARAPKHSQPLITAPWGESVRADTLTLFGMTRFNPYTSREASSERFVDWQFQRASEVVYGRAFSLAGYEALSPSERPVPAWQLARGQIFALSTLVTALLLLTWLPVALQSHRRKNDVDPDIASVSILLFIAPLIPVVAWMEIMRDVQLGVVVAEAFVSFCLRLFPASWPLTLLVTTLPVYAACRLLEWQSARMELRPDGVAAAASASQATS